MDDSDGVGGGGGRGSVSVDPVVDIVAEDMPEGALPSDEEDKAGNENDPHRLLNFELETIAPLEEKPEKSSKKSKKSKDEVDTTSKSKKKKSSDKNKELDKVDSTVSG